MKEFRRINLVFPMDKKFHETFLKRLILLMTKFLQKWKNLERCNFIEDIGHFWLR